MLYVITGPPTAGKSTWIQAHARPRDLVVDLDRIALALAGPGASDHDHDDVLLQVAMRARYAAIDEGVRHLDERDMYLIHTMPNPKAMARYRRLQARIVTLDPGEDVVMQRVRAMRQPGMVQVATKWYRHHHAHPARTVTEQRSRAW